jgi:hypothetical protein
LTLSTVIRANSAARGVVTAKFDAAKFDTLIGGMARLTQNWLLALVVRIRESAFAFPNPAAARDGQFVKLGQSALAADDLR